MIIGFTYDRLNIFLIYQYLIKIIMCTYKMNYPYNSRSLILSKRETVPSFKIEECWCKYMTMLT